MNNFFSGHNMANEIMGKTSLPMQMEKYVNDQRLGMESRKEFHPERLDADHETKKPFLPGITPTVKPSSEFYPKKMVCTEEKEPAVIVPKSDSLHKRLMELREEKPACYVKPEHTLNLESTYIPPSRPEPTYDISAKPPVTIPKPDPIISFNTERKTYIPKLNIPEIVKPSCDYSTPPYDLGTPASGSSSGGSYSGSSSSSRKSSRPVNPLDTLAENIQGKMREAEEWGRDVKNKVDTACNNVKNALDSIGNAMQKLFGG